MSISNLFGSDSRWIWAFWILLFYSFTIMHVYFQQGKLELYPMGFALGNNGLWETISLNKLLLPEEISVSALFSFAYVYLKRKVRSEQCWVNTKKFHLRNKYKQLACPNTLWRSKLTFQRLNFLLFYFWKINMET